MLGLAMVAAGLPDPRYGGGAIAAQGSGPCALLQTDEMASLVSNASVSDGVVWLQDGGLGACRYTLGDGAGRLILNITVSDASRVYAGMSAEPIRQALLQSVIAGTSDSVIPNVGEAAVFKADSALYVHGTAYVKGRILQIVLDGFDAREKKDEVIALVASAASRL